MSWLLLVLSIIDIVTSVSLKYQQTSRPRQRNNHQNISTLLDNLLRGYDNSIRPDFGATLQIALLVYLETAELCTPRISCIIILNRKKGPPAVVEVDIMVRSMGPISEVDMTYSMDCYFRQSWVDRRLAFPGNTTDTLALSISMLARIWKPDTYFYNGKQSYLHTITTPNKFVRLYQNGRVLYSSRLTIKAGCPMNLEDFPMDIQRCPLKFGSFGYTSQDVLYRWNRARQVAIADDMKLSQFDLIATPAANQTDTIINSDMKSEYSMLLVSFHLRRHMGNFLIQVYGPCVLLVVLSWVSFWLNREATADRVSLGITTVLTMTFLGLEARTDLPKVPYPTALDFFVFLSFSFIFATIIQFAIVHYFTKYGSGECYFSAEFYSDSSSDEEDWMTDNGSVKDTTLNIASRRNSTFNSTNNDPHLIEVIPLSPIHRRTSTHTWTNLTVCFGRSTDLHRENEEEKQKLATISSPKKSPNKQPEQQQQQQRRKRKKRTPRFNSVSKIDRASRIVFPILFITINIFYWYCYLSRTKRIRNING